MRNKRILIILLIAIIVIMSLGINSYALTLPYFKITSNNYAVGDKVDRDDVTTINVGSTLQLYGLKVYGRDIEINEEDYGTFVSEVYPTGLAWVSSNEAVATVSNTGLVTGISAGTAAIAASTGSDDETGSYIITVESNTTPPTTTWTDFSNAKFTVSYTTYQNAKITVSGVNFNENHRYEVYLSKTNISDASLPDRASAYLSKADDGTVYAGLVKEVSTLLTELSGTTYISIRESEKTSPSVNSMVVTNKALTLPKELPLASRLDVWLYNAEETGFTNMIYASLDRGVTYKIGKIDSNEILKEFKDGSESTAYEKLLAYAKADKGLKTGTASTIKDTIKPSWLSDMTTIQKNAYYYVYLDLDTVSGKYRPLEEIQIYRAGINTTNGKEFYHFRFGTIVVDDDKPTTDPSTSPSTTPTSDPTVVKDGKLPQTGETAVTIGFITVALLATGIGIYKFRKYKEMK